MKRLLAATVVCVGVSGSAAYAVDWSINSTVSESVELNDNQFLRTTPAGTVGSYTSLNSVFTGKTKTTRFDFTPDFTFRKYWGPGTEGTTLSQTMDEGAKLHFESLGKTPRDRDYIDGIWRQRNLAFAVLNELGLPSSSVGNVDTTTLAGGLERNLTATDFFTLSARTTSTDYQPSSAGTHFLDSSALSTIRHQSNRTATLTASSELEWLTFANAARTNVYILREMAGLDAQPLQALTFSGSAGAAIVTTRQNQIASSPLTAATPSSGTAVGFIGNAFLTYQWLKTTQVSFRALQSVSPSLVGSLSQLRSFDLTLRHTINNASSISASADYSQQTTSGVQSEFLSGSTTYSYQLAREWTFQATYRFLHTTSKTATSSLLFDPITGLPTTVVANSSRNANSNSILMVLTKQFVVLPSGT